MRIIVTIYNINTDEAEAVVCYSSNELDKVLKAYTWQVISTVYIYDKNFGTNA